MSQITILLKNKLKDFNQSYEKLDPKRKKGLLLAIFLGSALLFSELLLFQPMDKLKEANEENKKLIKQQNTLKTDFAKLSLEQAYKSEKNLIKKRDDLKKEIENLLIQGGNKNYVDSNQLQTTLEKVIRQTSGLKMNSFKNKESVNLKNEQTESILIKHNFEIVVEGNFSNIYDLLSNVESLSGLNIENITIFRNPQGGGLLGQIEFYVLNTNKYIYTF